MLEIYVDADACPVKPEVFKVARRYRLNVFIVSQTPMRTPRDGGRISCVAVGKGMDAADDWIVEHIGEDDICITADIPLASRCLALGAHALGTRGKPFTPESIGDALATRDLMSCLRESGMPSADAPPISQRDRSRFLDHLDRIIQAVRGKRSG